MLYHLLFPLHAQFPLFNVLRYITFRTIYASLTALILSIIIAPWFIRKVKEYQVGQYILEEAPKTHQIKAGTPTMGGAFILAAALIGTLLWADLSNAFVWIMLFVGFSFGLLGFADDFTKIKRRHNKGLSARAKLFWQFTLALCVGLFLYFHPGYDTHFAIPFFKGVNPDLGPGYILLIILVIVSSSNAVNFTDGLDGLAIGPFLMAIGTYLILSYLSGHIKIAQYLQIPYVAGTGEVTVICGALAGAGLGFLWYNAYPAQVIMGDVGALPLGALLGTAAVLVKQEVLLILVGGIFVIEALSVILQIGYFKITHGKRIFLMAPVHHHFELKGWPEPKVIVRFWIIAAIFGLIAISTLKLR